MTEQISCMNKNKYTVICSSWYCQWGTAECLD